MLVGAVEELTPQTAWAHRALEFPGLPGEAAAVFVVEHEEAVLAAGRSPLAELVAVMGGFHPGGEPAGLAGRLTACMREVLTRSGLDTGQIGWVALSEAGGPADERIGTAAVAGALHPDGAEPIRVREVLGECGAASGALQFAALLERCRADPGRCGLMAGWMPDGAFGTAVVKGCADVGARRR
jgi:3-oxoacyl-[acyl-carrier-protein] synthase II